MELAAGALVFLDVSVEKFSS